MMKYIKTIETLVGRAARRQDGYGACYRFGRPVYEVVREESLWTLKHYGIVTIKYDRRTRNLLHWYGEGASDRDSMNTFMALMDNRHYYFRYGNRMGFIMETEEGEQFVTS